MKYLTETKASKFLGKKIKGSESYDPSLLVSIPRFENRDVYGINSDNLPFVGYDIWHAYEFSVMTKSGLPVTRLLKIKYSCDSEFLVESKSLKLYLNSFNMSRFGENQSECLNICSKIITKDLSSALKTDIELEFIDNKTKRVDVFQSFENILKFVNPDKIVIDKIKETPELLVVEELNDSCTYALTFDSLRSNCRVTHQPDFGDVFVYYKSTRHIVEESLLKYLCSFRSEYHFHEECCEMIYKRLFDVLDIKNDGELLVCALYTRRGGIDISPVRRTPNCMLDDINILSDIKRLARYGVKQ